MADTARVTGSGQVTVPAEIRRELHLEKGDRVRFVRNDDGDFVLRRIMRVEELVGMFPTPAGLAIDDDFGNVIHEANEEWVATRMARLNPQADEE